MRDLHSFAAAVLEVLDAQKKYFKSRQKTDLIESKRLESRLRELAKSYLEVDTL